MQTTTPVTRVDLDPRDLLVDVNIRTDARLDKDFVASIRDFGVLVPITAVRTAAGEVRVRFGHRRTLAAIEADVATVPVEIVGDEATDDAGQIERILTQVAENEQRAALSENDRLSVVEQLNAFGMSAAQIAKRTKIKRDTVNNALAVAKSDLAKAAADRYEFLTLEQAAAVAEFEDDADAVKQLIVSAQNGSGFDHLLQRLRDQRTEQAAKQLVTDELVAAGLTIVDRPRWTDPAKPLNQIRTDDEPLTPEVHATCPGHVVWIDEEWNEDRTDDADYVDDQGDSWSVAYVPVYGCSDPVQFGHVEPETVRLRDSRNGSRVLDDKAKAERRQVIENNKAWRAAETVRREWLKNFLARKSAPKGSLGFIRNVVAEGDWQLRDGMDKQHRCARMLLGVEAPVPHWERTSQSDALIKALNDAGEARAQMITLGLVLGAFEATLDVHTWRSPNEGTARYLTQLTVWGYELSEIEQSMIGSNGDGE